jgi:hypothetical protein
VGNPREVTLMIDPTEETTPGMLGHLQRYGFTLLAGEFVNKTENERLGFQGNMPKTCGAYVWFMGGEIMYVGQGVDLDRRIPEHMRRLYDRPRNVPGGGHALYARKQLRAALATGNKVEVFIAQPELGKGSGFCQCPPKGGDVKGACRWGITLEDRVIAEIDPPWNVPRGQRGRRTH